MICITAFAVLVILLVVGVPVPFSFIGSSVVIVLLGGYDYSFLIPYGYNKAGSIILVAIPLFIFAGGFMEKGGMGEKIVNIADVLVGRIKGGLGVVAVLSCGIFSSISGSGAATLACIGGIMFPRMEAAGYPKGHSAALMSSACVLGLLLPPSLNMILFAFVGGQSILACFLSTAIPGILLIFLFSAVNLWLLRNNKTIIITESYNFSTTVKKMGKNTFSAIPALLCPIIILGGIYGGAMTPTEAAAVSAVYAIPVGFFIYKGLTLKNFKEVLVTSGTTSGAVLTMLVSVMILSRLFIMEDAPGKIIGFLSTISDNPTIMLLMINLFIIIIGMVMDDTSAILLLTPILLPVVTEIGVDPIHFAAIMGVNVGMGNVTPPCAPFLYLGARLGKANVGEMLTPTMYLILFAWIPALLITTYVPQFALWLPNLILG